ncbi:hypothetical protein ACJMK2_002356 [Sinanodonta woodiana]|uniref:Fucosyltransferase n=1 Tax=Sinanodonta woodiana TaxID=1069815 RepID=A0ABD3XV14_SINWO
MKLHGSLVKNYKLCFLLLAIVLLPVHWFLRMLYPSRPAHRLPLEDHGQFIKRWSSNSSPRAIIEGNGNYGVKKIKKILYWTNFFGIHPDEYVKQQKACSSSCGYECQFTGDRKELETSDAVMFHMYDTWTENWVLNTSKIVPLPKYHPPRQVWVMVNMEPLGNLWGNFEVLNGLLNWTMTYRADSTVFQPYGRIHKLTPMDKTHGTVNYFRNKNRTAVVRISNCKDYARRYRLVKEVNKYLDVDLLGKCYGKLCGYDSEDPLEEECGDVMKEYRFYLAFENSFCRDYVTEKYWLALKRDQIPIVNWKHVDPKIVIPNSYINVYDFPDIATFGEYIKSVNDNETLYNSYFNWKNEYTYTFYNNYVDMINKTKYIPNCVSCTICRALHEKNVPTQVYKDFDGWIRNDFCEDSNEINIRWKNMDRDIFDFQDMLHLN